MDALDNFYDDLKSGISAEDFLARYKLIVEFTHEIGITSDMRLARGRVKRLCDEVAPARLLIQHEFSDAFLVQFPLDDGAIDCNILTKTGICRKIQITVAQALERLNLMTELNEKGIGRGYLGLTDEMPKSSFDTAMERERMMYSTASAEKTLCSAISLCIAKKAKPKGADTLVILAPLGVLPTKRVLEIAPQFEEIAAVSKFTSVFVVGGGEWRGRAIQIK